MELLEKDEEYISSLLKQGKKVVTNGDIFLMRS